MTAISNVFCDEFIACGSDSFLTKRTSAGVEHVETERKKIFPLQGLPGAISYWGFAGLESLNVAGELEALATRAHAAASLEQFAHEVRDHFNTLFGKYPGIPKNERGLGMHLVGYEVVEGFRIPEIFLMTNFKGIPYGELAESLGCSRRTYLTIKDIDGTDEQLLEHREPQFRKVVYEHLAAGNVLYFNNGDPELFTIAADGLLKSMKALDERGVLKNDTDRWRHLATEPIRIIADMQRSYVKEDYRLIGGKIHDLVVQPDGQYFSDSGVVTKRWSER